jgi:hypothetical protein
VCTNAQIQDEIAVQNMLDQLFADNSKKDASLINAVMNS